MGKIKNKNMNSIPWLKWKDNIMENKYKVLSDRYFTFEIFEEVFKAINERASTSDDHMFKAGVASAEAAVRRLREQYYESIKKMYAQEDTQ